MRFFVVHIMLYLSSISKGRVVLAREECQCQAVPLSRQGSRYCGSDFSLAGPVPRIPDLNKGKCWRTSMDQVLYLNN